MFQGVPRLALLGDPPDRPLLPLDSLPDGGTRHLHVLEGGGRGQTHPAGRERVQEGQSHRRGGGEAATAGATTASTIRN